jgi:pimeloyl-ACP methyl ester carboxylesterase/mannose-6-phosphate isomerase-like protein (cupin superfamily)
MTQHEGEHGARHVRLADLPKAEIGDHLWHPVRRALGASGFGVGAYSAVRAGDVLVGAHDETGLGSNRHEELYVVLAGRALFELDGREVEVGPEEFLLVDPEVRRGARALADATSVLVIGGAPGAVAPAPYEHWYAALTTADPHDAAEIAAGGLAQFPDHGQLNYQVACFRALAGELDVAAGHLRRAVASDERAWEWLQDDSDLDALRSVPGAVPMRSRVGPLHVEQAGAGPDVVLVHAGVADGRMWDLQWVEWSARNRVTRLDLRGFGRSDPPEGAYSHAADVLSVLDALEIERATLVGASFGGRVALDLAATEPGRVVGLVLACAGLPDHDWSDELQAFGAAEDEAIEAGDLDRATEVNVDFWVPAASESVRAAIREQQRNAFALQVGRDDEEMLLTEDLTARIGTVDVTTLVLVGESDHSDFHAIADRLAAALPDARRETVSGAGHLPSLERPDAFDAVVRPFLDSLA